MNSDNFKYIRKEKKKCIQNSYEGFEKKCEKDLVFEEIIGGTIIPVRRGNGASQDFGGVLTASGDFVNSSIVPGWIVGWYDDFQSLSSDLTVVYCGRMIGHWGHFLLECLTRLWFFLEHDDPKYRYVFIVKEGSKPQIEGNIAQFFDLLGLRDRLIFLDYATRFKKVIVPERSFQYRRFYYPQFISVFDKIIENALQNELDSNFSKKIYLSRSAFERAQQSEIGLELLDSFFESNGFEVVYPERISLIELIHILHNADVCASESGTAAHNFLFCTNRKKVIVVERQAVVNYAQASIDIIRKFNTIYLDANLAFDYVYQPCLLFYSSYFKLMVRDYCYLSPDISLINKESLQENLDKYYSIFSRLNPGGVTEKRLNDEEKNCFFEAICESYDEIDKII